MPVADSGARSTLGFLVVLGQRRFMAGDRRPFDDLQMKPRKLGLPRDLLIEPVLDRERCPAA